VQLNGITNYFAFEKVKNNKIRSKIINLLFLLVESEHSVLVIVAITSAITPRTTPWTKSSTPHTPIGINNSNWVWWNYLWGHHWIYRS
jgi:hypothetical protein